MNATPGGGSRRVDLVLPVNPARNQDGERMRICLSSLARHMDPNGVGELLIVVPDGATPASCVARTWQGDLVPFKTKVVRDSALLGSNAWQKRAGGWYTQQFVKLAAARHLSSDFYVTLDSDVVLTRATSFEDLVPNGRAATLYYERSVHANWWCGSAQILDVAPELERPAMGVTPAVLSARIARELVAFLEERDSAPWYRSLVEFIDVRKRNGTWPPRPEQLLAAPTEYTLYQLFAEMKGYMERFHAPAPHVWCSEQVFHASGLGQLTERIASASSSRGHFFVLQSVLGLSPRQVWSLLGRAFGLEGESRAMRADAPVGGAPGGSPSCGSWA